VAEPGRTTQTLVLASGNAGKLRELSAMLTPLGWNVARQSDWSVPEAVEDGRSFIENALIKARHASRHTGLPSLGDDSGLVVDALQGAPGIFSARYAGAGAGDDENNLKLLNELKGLPSAQRVAHFYCAMALVRHEDDPAPLLATGSWDGGITETATGAGGFGYDPIFWVPERACTSAELPADEKNRISHRGRALAQMLEQLAAF
jgi:XTP/dITP diphosphohydrolase